MKMKTRMTALFLALVLVFTACCTGCGNQGGTNSSENVGNTENQYSGELEFVTLTWYYPGNYPQNDQDEVFAAINEKIKEKINAEVKFMPISWGDYDQKMTLADSAGEAYDLCFTSDWTNNYLQNVAKGAYLPLDELLEEYAPQTYASVPESYWDATRVNGQIYGIINQQIIARSTMISVNKELADKYNFDPESIDNNLENVESYLKQIADNEPDSIVPISMKFSAENAYYFGMELLAGDNNPCAIYMDDADAKVFNVFKSEEFKEYVKMQSEWNQAGYTLGEDGLTSEDSFSISEGKRGAWISGTYKPGVQAEEISKWGLDMYCVPLSTPYTSTSGVVATLNAVGRNSENPERAVMLMELLNTDKEIYNMLVYGLEGKHWNKLEGDYIEIAENSGYTTGTAWMFGCTFNAYLLEGQDADVWEQTKEMNASANVSPLLGFNFDPEPVKTEIAQCSSLISQYIPLFTYGIGSLDKEYVEFIEKLDIAGAQTIVDEMQRQIDEWKENK